MDVTGQKNKTCVPIDNLLPSITSIWLATAIYNINLLRCSHAGGLYDANDMMKM